MKTKKGIYLDLEDSDYKYRIGEYIFYFSSIVYRDKFIKQSNEFTKQEGIKFKIKYKLTLSDVNIFLFTLYGKIEKRGYKVARVNSRGKPIQIIREYPTIINFILL